MFSSLLDFLFPRRSLTGGEGAWITAEERLRLKAEPIVVETQALRHLGLKYIDRIVAGCAYQEKPLVRRAIQTLKYARVRELAKDLAVLLEVASQFILTHPDAPVLCPVPLHWIRRYSRGFNQSDLLAIALAHRRGWPLQHLLRRNRPTGHQVGRRKEERLSALTDAFVVRTDVLPRNIVLIDDLSTSGATLDACAQVLKEAGVPLVQGLVVAHG